MAHYKHLSITQSHKAGVMKWSIWNCCPHSVSCFADAFHCSFCPSRAVRKMESRMKNRSREWFVHGNASLGNIDGWSFPFWKAKVDPGPCLETNRANCHLDFEWDHLQQTVLLQAIHQASPSLFCHSPCLLGISAHQSSAAILSAASLTNSQHLEVATFLGRFSWGDCTVHPKQYLFVWKASGGTEMQIQTSQRQMQLQLRCSRHKDGDTRNVSGHTS